MRLLLAAMLAFWCFCTKAAIFQNSLNTNVLGTNLVWTPATRILEIENNSGAFVITSNGLSIVQISPLPGANVLPALNLLQYLQFNSTTNRLTIANNALLLDGVPVGGTSETNVSNNFYTTNNFFVNGKGNTLIVTQALTLNYVKTNLLSTDANGLVTTTKFGAGITWDPATQTISATAGGSATAWRPNTALTYSSSNVVIDGSGGTNFYLALTGATFFATPANIPASKTTNTFFTVYFQQPSTGTCLVSWTNASFFFPGNSPFQPLTNANAMSSVTFTMSPFTNGIFLGDYGTLY